MSHNDTIVAQATPPGRGGVGILRISGLKARDVAQAVLGKLPKPRYADYLPFKDSDGSALDQGIAAADILSGGLMRGMDRLGVDFSAGIAFVPEMLIAARCMAAATELLKPHMAGESSETVGRVCLGTVRGDMHDIGKNLVKIMMEGSGLEVVDLGVDVTAEQFVDTAIEQHCDIIACSSLLTTTMPEMRAVVELSKARGIRDQVKIFVGGAPITQGYSDEIGADAYCPDAASAARTAVAMLRGA